MFKSLLKTQYLIVSEIKAHSKILGTFFKVKEGHKILRNLHQLFDWQYIGQTAIGGDFAKFCGLLRIYELYEETFSGNSSPFFKKD